MDREARVYRELLQPASLGTPRFYGAHMIEPDGRTLVLLEYFEGRKLKKEQEQETWLAVVKWLARMHQYFLARQDRLKSSLFLPRHDAEFYFKWACRATESASSVSAKLCASMKRLLSRYDKVAGPLGSTATLVHGEFYSTNVMVSGDAQHLRICAFDWETAAIGCGALDLTYLFRQRCGIEEPRLIRAYLEGLREAGGSPVSLSELQSQILRARIHELMCRIWSGVHYRHAPAQKIEKYSDRASLFIESL
jgi:Ser/Thr protein kinase RdoA (MazF antagonist)